MPTLDGLNLHLPGERSTAGVAVLLDNGEDAAFDFTLDSFRATSVPKSHFLVVRYAVATQPVPEDVLKQGFGAAQVALDYLSAHGEADLRTSGYNEYVVWWPVANGLAVRVCLAAPLSASLSATPELSTSAPSFSTSATQWHPSMRFYRQSQLALTYTRHCASCGLQWRIFSTLSHRSSPVNQKLHG